MQYATITDKVLKHRITGRIFDRVAVYPKHDSEGRVCAFSFRIRDRDNGCEFNVDDEKFFHQSYGPYDDSKPKLRFRPFKFLYHVLRAVLLLIMLIPACFIFTVSLVFEVAFGFAKWEATMPYELFKSYGTAWREVFTWK